MIRDHADPEGRLYEVAHPRQELDPRFHVHFDFDGAVRNREPRPLPETHKYRVFPGSSAQEAEHGRLDIRIWRPRRHSQCAVALMVRPPRFTLQILGNEVV